MNPSSFSIAALGVSGLALALSIGVVLRGPHPGDPAEGTPALTESGAPEWVAQAEHDRVLGALRAELDALGNQVAMSAAAPDTRSPVHRGPSSEEYAAALERIEALEQRLDALDAILGLSGEPGAEDPISALPMLNGIFGTRERGPAPSVEDAKTAALDLAASEEKRLEALRSLRGRKLEDGSDARDDDVVLAMVDLAETSEDPDVRADVYRQMSGCSNPHLRGPLLRSLEYDDNARVREEAAETLEDFLPDDEVLAALQRALVSDPAPGVKAQAAESIYGGK